MIQFSQRRGHPAKLADGVHGAGSGLQRSTRRSSAGVEHLREHRYPLRDAEADGTLHYVARTYSRENDAIYDGLSRPGARVVTFAPILKHNIFPLPQLLDALQKLGAGRPGASRGD